VLHDTPPEPAPRTAFDPSRSGPDLRRGTRLYLLQTDSAEWLIPVRPKGNGASSTSGSDTPLRKSSPRHLRGPILSSRAETPIAGRGAAAGLLESATPAAAFQPRRAALLGAPTPDLQRLANRAGLPGALTLRALGSPTLAALHPQRTNSGFHPRRCPAGHLGPEHVGPARVRCGGLRR